MKKEARLHELNNLTLGELLALYAQIGDELRTRGVVRSANNPTGDLAEYLFCKAFGWRQAPNSERGFDAHGTDGTRYQIKGRRLHLENKSRQLSAIRELESKPFDFLAGVLFDHEFRVVRAVLIPHSIVVERSKHVTRTNSYTFFLHDVIWSLPDAKDVTHEVAAAMP